MKKNLFYYNFKIADIHVKIESELAIEINPAFVVFADEAHKEADYTVSVRKSSELPTPVGRCVFEEKGILVFRTENNTYFRILGDCHSDKGSYAVSFFDWKNKTIDVQFLEDKKEHVDHVMGIFKCIAWENILLNEKRVMMHASYIKTSYGGIAFSGPSGIGKTTQAELWCSYKGAEMINGDKVILYKKEDRWMGYGSPYAGSSRCYVNDSCELKCLFFLKQGTACSLRRMSLTECFKQIYSSITLNRWDAENIKMVCDLAEELAAKIPIYEFTCTPDEDAVYFLQKKCLEKE